MSTFTDNARTLKALNQSLASISMADPSLEQVVSTEDISFDIKRKAYIGIEVFDDVIRKLVKEYYSLEADYRENLSGRFVTDLYQLDQMLFNTPLIYKEDIRWYDDKNALQRERLSVSRAYLSLFSTVENKSVQVSEDDFWRCFDFKDVSERLHLSPSFKGIASLFTEDNSFNQIEKYCNLLENITDDVILMSKDYETVLSRMIESFMTQTSLSKSERVDLNAPSALVCGVQIKPYITSTINRKWFKSTIKTNIGDSVSDVKVLLEEPYKYLTRQTEDNESAVKNILTLAKNPDTDALLKKLKRVISNLVDQIALSSKRLVRLGDELREIPDKDIDGMYNEGLTDIAVLLTVYGGSLHEVLRFAVAVAMAAETTYKEFHRTVGKVDNLHREVTSYIERRKKDVRFR